MTVCPPDCFISLHKGWREQEREADVVGMFFVCVCVFLFCFVKMVFVYKFVFGGRLKAVGEGGEVGGGEREF
jgi:hypothetical protein